MYSKSCSKLQGRVPRASVSELSTFTYFTRVIYAISYIDII